MSYPAAVSVRLQENVLVLSWQQLDLRKLISICKFILKQLYYIMPYCLFLFVLYFTYINNLSHGYSFGSV